MNVFSTLKLTVPKPFRVNASQKHVNLSLLLCTSFTQNLF
ncbi:hypothetical protein JCM19274_2250 [Algibacter lectus]|uniref:Uncharacterized protein n=1 Tax=Algibacter lectus TaxID=221126 RepID=A0A090WVR9_9FLAO|nr:hypothetical protein JCM19274_2250 [Algibacter lectus]